MKNNLVMEIQQIVAMSEGGEGFIPMPTYLYVQRYGRSIEEEMNAITKLLGEKQCFVFKTRRIQQKETVLRSFLMELEKHATLGKDFSGCVLLELSDENEPEEMQDFLDYVAKQKQLKCIFTVNAKQKEEAVRQLLEQYFFVRVVEGQKYDGAEQLNLLKEIFMEYHFEVDEEALEIFQQFLMEKEWQETDMVQNRIRNIAKNIVYEKMIDQTKENRHVSKDDALEAIQKLQQEAPKHNVIGFCF